MQELQEAAQANTTHASATGAPANMFEQLGDATGMFWHYNPITVMKHVNGLILAENRELQEDEFTDTNVLVDEDYFLTDFVQWQASSSSHMSSGSFAARPSSCVARRASCSSSLNVNATSRSSTMPAQISARNAA